MKKQVDWFVRATTIALIGILFIVIFGWMLPQVLREKLPDRNTPFTRDEKAQLMEKWPEGRFEDKGYRVCSNGREFWFRPQGKVWSGEPCWR